MKTALVVLLLLCVPGFAVVACAQTEKSFPTNDEINLMLTHTERAMAQYKPLIGQETNQMGKSYADAAAKDLQVVNGLEMALKAFRASPQVFNGPLGFAFSELLDDADRNAVLCESGAFSQAALRIMAGDTNKASSLLQLAQSCSDADALIYTASENADSLYQRYVEAEGKLAAQGVEAAEKCTDILKKNDNAPKK